MGLLGQVPWDTDSEKEMYTEKVCSEHSGYHAVTTEASVNPKGCSGARQGGMSLELSHQSLDMVMSWGGSMTMG
jgi:hypothetical protein